MREAPHRIELARLPTPLEPLPHLSRAWGGPTLWVKRDDLTGFGLSGNKVRKLEYHLASARRAEATTVITCGALQSNHCRTTALACARLGLACLVLLRTPDGRPPGEARGNYLLDRLAGAEVRFVTPEQYVKVSELMADEADRVQAEGGSAWLIPEGASDWLGMWAFAGAFRELHEQLRLIPGRVGAIWHAASSGGTTAGLGWGAEALGRQVPLVAVSVGDPAATLEGKVRAIWEEAALRSQASAPAGAAIEYLDDYVGSGYGVAAEQELSVEAEFMRRSGLLVDPTYTGKAVYALRREIERGRFQTGDHVVFWHTGGGFAALAQDWQAVGGTWSRSSWLTGDG